MLFFDLEVWAGLYALTLLEIALGADNFLHIRRSLDSLSLESKAKAHKTIAILTVAGRILLILGLVSLLRLPPTYLYGKAVPLHEIVLVGGACILIIKVSLDSLRVMLFPNAVNRSQTENRSLGVLITQIVLLDLFLSIDSAITAVAMAEEVLVMVLAILLAEWVMSLWAESIDAYLKNNPRAKGLINSFTMMLAMVMILRANGTAIPMDLLYCILLFIVAMQVGIDAPSYLRKRFAKAKPIKQVRKRQAQVLEHTLLGETPSMVLPLESEMPANSLANQVEECMTNLVNLPVGEFEYQFYSPETGQ